MLASENKQFVPNKITLVTILLSSMVIIMGAAAVAPALKPIAQHFAIDSEFTIALVISLPALCAALMGFAIGYLADRFGKARILFICLVIFTVSGVICFFIDDFTIILVFRFILGLGISGISLATTALIGEYYTGIARAKVIGYQAAATGAGTMILETLGGSLADLDWNYPFLIYLIGVPILILGLISVRSPPVPRAVRTETSAPDEKIDKRGVFFEYAMIFLGMFMMFVLPMNFSYYINEMGESYTMVGILLGVLGLAQAGFSLAYSRRVTKLDIHTTFGLAFLSICVGLALLYLQNLAACFASMVFIGIGMGLISLTVIAQLSVLSTPATSGKIMGGYAVFLNLATFTSTLVFAPILAVMGTYSSSYLVVSVIALAICVMLLAYGVVSRRSAGRAVPVSAGKPEMDVHASEFPVMYGSILVATDGSPSSEYAVRCAVNIARKNEAPLTVLHVVNPDAPNIVGFVGEADSDRPGVFDEAVRLCGEAGVEVRTETLTGQPADVIAEESAHHGLVVCGSVGRTDTRRALIGSVAEKVVRTAHCPVLICRDEHGSK